MGPSLAAFIPSQGSVGTKLTSLLLFPGDFNSAQQLNMGEAWRTVGMFRKERQLAIPRDELRRGGLFWGSLWLLCFHDCWGQRPAVCEREREADWAVRRVPESQ